MRRYMTMKQKVIASTSVVGLIALIAFFILSGGNADLFSQKDNAKIGADKPPAIANDAIKQLNDTYIRVSEALVPTVVSIGVIIEGDKAMDPFEEQFREFFRHFQGPDVDPEENLPRREGGGSGVIISENGYIITNNHVVANASEITVTTHDRKEYKAEIIGTDPLTDLAVIKIEANGLTPAHMGDIQDIKVGEIVFAIGNPLGLNSTVTNGIVSAIGRGGMGLLNRESGYAVENFIQTDAAINPGNSGGGLYNITGSLIGINTAIATRTGTYIGYGFAIPIDIVSSVVRDLIDDGEINRGYIGVQISTVDELLARSVGLDKVEGVLVNDVIADSPAEEAGIEPGDVILKLDGETVATSNELQSKIVQRRAGDEVKLEIWRNEKKIYKTVKLKPRDGEEIAENNAKKGEEEVEQEDNASFEDLGFSVESLSKKQKEDYNVDNGVLVTDVKRYSVAFDRQLFPNGVIVKADRKAIKSISDLKEVIESKKKGEAILLQVKYNDANRIIALEIP
jgi:serine protease Do